jgi:hypothetical protein
VGEIIGGSQREERAAVLEKRMAEFNINRRICGGISTCASTAGLSMPVSVWASKGQSCI